MTYALFSDLHANPRALENVLEDARRFGAEKLICLGDVVGYGPSAEETVALVRREVDVCLMGNHDAAVSAVISGENFTLYALQGVKRHRDETSVENRQWLSQLALTCDGNGFACAHGEFSNPKAFRYVMKPIDALASWTTRAEPLLFVGHTHAAGVISQTKDGLFGTEPPKDGLVIEPHCRYLVNVGSVGYPRRDKDSVYCLYDTERKVVTWRKLPFDYRWYEKTMKSKGIDLPSWWRRQEQVWTRWFKFM